MRTSPHRTRRVIGSVLGAAAALALAASPVLGAVTFDPSNGTGHVDGADVQAAFGWRDGTFAANGRKIGFSLRSVGSLSWDCGGATLVGTVDESRGVNASLLGATTRGNGGGVSGYDLTGFSGGAPAGASCSSGDPANVTWHGTRVLYAHFKAQSASLWSDSN